MPNGVGRTADFHDGSERVREPQFQTMQKVAGGFRPTSVLDNLTPTSGNGMGSADKERAMYGVKNSAIGQSEGTFDKSLWLRNEPQARYRNFGGSDGR